MKTNTKRYSITLIVFFVIYMFLTSFQMLVFDVEKIIAAANSGSIGLHFYHTEDSYHSNGYKWLAWTWIQGISQGKATNCSGALDSSEFFNEKVPDNKPHYFDIELTDKEMEALKSGKKFGIVMVQLKDGETTPSWDKKDAPDRFISPKFDAQNRADVYVMYEDSFAYDDIAEAKLAFEQLINPKFVNTKEITFSVTSEIAAGSVATLVSGEIEYTANVNIDAQNNKKGHVKFDSLVFDFGTSYILHVDGFRKGKAVEKTRLYDTQEFIEDYESYSGELGAIWSENQTEFKVWAPLASYASVRFYKYGDTSKSELVKEDLSLNKLLSDGKWSGVWQGISKGDLHGVYYTYFIKNYDDTVETIDVYAKAGGVNGERGMVVDLSRTNPDGWDSHIPLYAVEGNTNHLEPVIWEVHVRDFSIHPDSGMRYKGKYLAFTEQNTTLKSDSSIKTGINYLKELGVTYVHLLPVFDYETVNEYNALDMSYDEKFNWGYDPKNYNFPEGSYSTNPYDGEVRIKEFKQMIMALHEAGISVVMDMVYNHTKSTDSHAFSKTVPKYYYRTDDNGNYSDNSGCGNETASERLMMRKFMVDSVKYWAEEYKIDAFRFDLMALHDVNTMNKIREELDKLNNGKGYNILMYGEPWMSGSISAIKRGESPADRANMWKLNSRIAAFSDTMRDGIRGKHDRNDPKGGFVNNNPKGTYQMVQHGLEGGVRQEANANFIKFNASSQCVSYISKHDNYALYDQLSLTVKGKGVSHFSYSTRDNNLIARNKMAASINFMSQGIIFFQAGEEIARVKYGNDDSYASSTKINQIDYGRQKEFKDLFDYYKGLIQIRKAFSKFHLSIKASDSHGDFKHLNDDDAMVYYMKGRNGDAFTDMVVVLNASGTTKTIDIQKVGYPSSWSIIANEDRAGLTEIYPTDNSVMIAPYTSLILVPKL